MIEIFLSECQWVKINKKFKILLSYLLVDIQISIKVYALKFQEKGSFNCSTSLKKVI
jgi:hypothetical protein